MQCELMKKLYIQVFSELFFVFNIVRYNYIKIIFSFKNFVLDNLN